MLWVVGLVLSGFIRSRIYQAITCQYTSALYSTYTSLHLMHFIILPPPHTLYYIYNNDSIKQFSKNYVNQNAKCHWFKNHLGMISHPRKNVLLIASSTFDIISLSQFVRSLELLSRILIIPIAISWYLLRALFNAESLYFSYPCRLRLSCGISNWD